MSKERPVNLKLTSIHFPIPAIASILHRISGVILFFFIPAVLWVLWYSLKSQSSYDVLKGFMSYFWLRFAVWVFISALLYHLLAGIRHLMMDLGWGESLNGGRIGAWFVTVLSIVLIVLLGIYILIGLANVVW